MRKKGLTFCMLSWQGFAQAGAFHHAHSTFPQRRPPPPPIEKVSRYDANGNYSGDFRRKPQYDLQSAAASLETDSAYSTGGQAK